MKRLALATLGALSLVAACDPKPPGGVDPNVRTIVLPTETEPPLADKPGKSEFFAACRTCHTTGYVFNQPRFSRKVWTAEVEKMRAVYGAPIPNDMTKTIVDYLVAVNGVEE